MSEILFGSEFSCWSEMFEMIVKMIEAVVVVDIVVGHVVGVEDVVEKNVVPSEVFELETV